MEGKDKKKLESEKRDVFVNNIDQTKVDELLSELTNFQYVILIMT
jgi:hypothetical protein